MTTSIDVDLIRHPRTYQPDRFINRETELETVANRVRLAQSRVSIMDPVINFWGIKGIGKTWILQELRHRYTYDPTVGTTIVSAEPPTFALIYTFPDEQTTLALDQLVRELANEALMQIGAELSAQEQADLTEANNSHDINSLVRILLTLSRRFVPLILLDNTDKARAEDWEALESSLIEPLVSTGRVLVIVAGRRQVPRWRRFEVRRRVLEPEQSRVRPFDKQDVSEQLAQRQYHIPIDLFFPYTAGNPHLVEALAHHIAKWTKSVQISTLDQEWFDHHQAELLAILRKSEEQLLENVPSDLVPILNEVSPLRSYRLEALRFMLEDHELGTQRRPDGYYLNLLRALDQQTEVVWWDRKRRAYVTSQVVRQIMGRRQFLESREAFIIKHTRASSMYWSWVHEYPRASEDFVGEIWYHLGQIYAANQNIGFLMAESKKALRFACEHLNLDRLLVMQQQLGDHENDRELHDLLPDDIRNELIRELDRFLNEKTE